jgi:NADH-quinone oxidoreductase subunit C
MIHMSESKFGPVTSPAAIAAKNVVIYAKQRALLEAHPLAKILLGAVWPETASAATSSHAPLYKDGITPVSIDMPSLTVAKENLLQLVDFLRNDPNFRYDFLLDLTAVDFLGSPRAEDAAENAGCRFRIVYLLRPMDNERRTATFRICVPLNEGDEAPTLTEVWPAANWPEREVFDLMGLKFAGHPNMRRIVLPDNYRGHPLRKDFPVKGIGEDYLIEDLLYKRRNVD